VLVSHANTHCGNIIQEYIQSAALPVGNLLLQVRMTEHGEGHPSGLQKLKSTCAVQIMFPG
jgi:hypothetical protein